MRQAVVYWIHTESHSDPDTEGYIGVTDNFDRRMKRHKETPKGIMANVIAKYGWDNLTVDVLHTFSEELCYQLEYEYRPTRLIGWNIAEGGLHRGPTECPEKRRERLLANPPSRMPHVREMRREYFINNNPMNNPDIIAKMKASNKELYTKQYTCEHCSKSANKSNYIRWHGDNCKQREN